MAELCRKNALPSVGCVIMASGLARRFGSNKLLADFGGRPLLFRALEVTATPALAARVVVTRSAKVKALCDAQAVPCLLHSLPGRNDTVRLGLEALFSGTAQLPDIRLRAPDRVICGQTEESLLSGALYGAAAMTEGLAQRMEQELGCPCTLVLTGGLGRFVAPLCRREAVYDEDLLLRGLWKLYTVNCPSADKP